MCQGLAPEPVITHVPDPLSIGRGKVMPADTQDPVLIHTYLLHMASNVGVRLRRHQLHANCFLSD